MNVAAEAASVFAMTLPGAVRVNIVGSTYILGAGKDIDVLVLCENKHDTLNVSGVVNSGWALETDEKYEGSEFFSIRKGDVNLLLTDDEEFFDGFAMAAEVCKYLKLADRAQRVAVHRIIRDGFDAEDASL